MQVFWDPIQLAHDPRFFLMRGRVQANFERPARAESLLAACHAMRLPVTAPPPLDVARLLAVHDAGYVDFLRDGYAAWAALPEPGEEIVANTHPTPDMLVSGARPSPHIVARAGWYTADAACPIGAGTWPAVMAAASGAVAAAEVVAEGGSAYALARPPGHHAYRARAGGHCYVNNAALAAAHLRARGAERVAVLDIDSHHGNGTQGIFWDRADILFVSVHGDPDRYYPWYTGRADERGAGAGEGRNLNLPLPIGSGDAPWLAAVQAGVDAIAAFGADALVVSLGFDASEHEPLNALSVTADGFERAGAMIGALRRPTALVQEGGYAVDVLGGLLTRFMTGFAPNR